MRQNSQPICEGHACSHAVDFDSHVPLPPTGAGAGLLLSDGFRTNFLELLRRIVAHTRLPREHHRLAARDRFQALLRQHTFGIFHMIVNRDLKFSVGEFEPVGLVRIDLIEDYPSALCFGYQIGFSHG